MNSRYLNEIEKNLDVIYKNIFNVYHFLYQLKTDNNISNEEKQEIKSFIEERIPNLEVTFIVGDNCLNIYRVEKYITKSTLLSVWGTKLFDKYIDEPDEEQKIKKHGKTVWMWLISMDRVRRIERDSSFRNDWNKWKRKSFENRFEGLENTNYKQIWLKES